MKTAVNFISKELEAIKVAGTFKEERIILSSQSSRIDTSNKK